ncbi:hypothetical protein OG239_42690 (plasmid) [Streptomyces sp. NBC_00868]|uniref:hypothetical protein n=1 Tax=Streptomyces sp. NBC_00868 TaxID=2903683 RepID=UPI003870C695|nr:hypothetical protein OG239_42690 [Streptomyces sp. NBC_00868]
MPDRRPAPVPPLEPDPDLVDNLEGGGRKRRSDKEAVEKAKAKAKAKGARPFTGASVS